MQGETIEVDGISTHYFDVGQGPPVVLIHGAALGIDAEFTWFRQIESLAWDHRVIAFDQPGFGRSAMPPGGYMGRERRAAHALAFLRRLGIGDAVLVGHSEGGYIALRIAQLAPRLVSALVVVTSGSAAPMLGGDPDDAWMAASNALYTVGDVAEESFLAGLHAYSLHWDPRMEELARASIRRALKSGHLELMRTLPPEETDMRRYMRVQQEILQPGLAHLQVPTLLIWSGDDDTVPVERGVALMRALPCADLLVLPRARHNVMHDRHDAFDSALRRFIADAATADHHPDMIEEAAR